MKVKIFDENFWITERGVSRPISKGTIEKEYLVFKTHNESTPLIK
jgi:hypothetical protein